MANPTRYPVIAIGGAEDKVGQRTILTHFFKGAGDRQARIGIVPCASQEPSVVGGRYHRLFSEMGAQSVQILDIRHANECDNSRWLQILDSCTGVFLSGGDQVRLFNLIRNSIFTRTLEERLASGRLVLAGTSAGAAVMGENMIASGSSGESPNRSLVELMDGLGLVPEVVVDQHFHNRNRMARLLSAIAATPDKLGLGIDEDTCVAIRDDDTFDVIGKGTVTVIDPQELTHTNHDSVQGTTPLSLHGLKVHILQAGDRYDYKRRLVCTSDHSVAHGLSSPLRAVS